MVNMNGPVKMASYDMAGKTAVVTGGTKGIGKAIALAFGQCGANVVVAGRHEDECTAVAEAITSAGGHGKGIRTDVRNIDEIDALIAGAAETFGGVDILINCAGVAITKKILDLDVEDYDMIMETNLRSSGSCDEGIRKGRKNHQYCFCWRLKRYKRTFALRCLQGRCNQSDEDHGP